jgi:uncharacterized damage-inducible protein DinB
MAITDSLLPEFDHEMATTRRLLDRVPDADLGWKPHEKSMSLGQLAGHIANIPYWASAVLSQSYFDVGTGGIDTRPRTPASAAQVVADFETKAGAARTALAAASDADMLAAWTLKNEGHEVFTMPRVAALRSFVMNHQIHHRGPLSVYLRLRNVPVPPIYGPTADES